MLAFADEANSKLRMPEGPLNKLWGWKCSTPAEQVFDPCSRQLGWGSHVCMRGRVLSVICTQFVNFFWNVKKKHFVLSRGGGTQMSTLQMDGPWKHVSLRHFLLSIHNCLGCCTSLDADVSKLVLLSSCQDDHPHWLQQSQVDTERCIRLFLHHLPPTNIVPGKWVGFGHV